MRSFTVKNISALLLLTIGLMVWGSGMVKGQDCITKRLYASSSSKSVPLLSSVTNDNNAVDGDPQTASIMNLGLVGAISQDLSFATAAPINTPVIVKIGGGNSLLGVGVSVKVEAYDESGIAVPSASVTITGLLALLNGDNQQEIAVSSSTIKIKKIRVTLGTTLALGLSLKVYDAYYSTSTTSINCETITDELHGVEVPLGLLGFTGSILNPLNSYDNDVTTATTLNATVGLIATTQQTIIFPSLAQPNDTVKILVQSPGVLLEAKVLGALTYTTYEGPGNEKEKLYNNSALIKISLLSTSTSKAWVSFVVTKTFDRLKISLGGTLSALSSIDIFEVKRSVAKPVPKIDNVLTSSKTICAGKSAQLTITAAACTSYNWYNSIGALILSNSTTYSTPTNLAPNATYKYYVEAVRSGCAATKSTKTEVDITVNPLPITPPITIQ